MANDYNDIFEHVLTSTNILSNYNFGEIAILKKTLLCVSFPHCLGQKYAVAKQRYALSIFVPFPLKGISYVNDSEISLVFIVKHKILS